MKSTDTKKKVFHLLPNAHLDPVWLWDWREGLNEGLITVRTILNLMEEFPELTFMRGESAIYEHIQKTDSKTFDRIQEKIAEGRWDVVGGTVIQPDTNLVSTEVLCREFERGLSYFEQNLGVRPTIAWLADSFGHSAGLPNIFSAFGMTGFAFTRPQRAQFPMKEPAFWWEGSWQNRILCYRQFWMWYCSERNNVPEILDSTLAGAKTDPFQNHGVLFGLGNHGGGPTRRHIQDVLAWRKLHPEVEVRFSTLHGFFEALQKEISEASAPKIPVVKGEFGFCLRSCYSSVQKFKSLYRQGESFITEAETARSMINVATRTSTPGLGKAWDALLFNAFHDILPGSSIERAFEEQQAWMGGALHLAQEVKFTALNELAARVDTTVPPPFHSDRATDVPLLVWNPLAQPFQGLVELEASLDYRHIWEYKDRVQELPIVVHDNKGKLLPSQVIQTEHTSMQDVPWRVRVLVPLKIPAMGWTVVRLGYRDEWPKLKVQSARWTIKTGANPQIGNADWKVAVQNGRLQISKKGQPFFSGKRGLELKVWEDLYGSWGGMNEEKDSYLLNKVLETWNLTKSAVIESGPLRAKLWTRWQGKGKGKGKSSWIDLTFSIGLDQPYLRVEGRILWNERSARLKLTLPCQGIVEYDVPGATVRRDVEGHVPGGRWVTRSMGAKKVGFASDVLSDFDATKSELQVTLARASRYANDVRTKADEKMWEPATDCGELKFRFSLFAGGVNPDQAAQSLLYPPTAFIAPAQKGSLPRQGSLGYLTPSSVKLLSVEEITPGSLKLRVQNRARQPIQAMFVLGEKVIELPELKNQQIGTFVVKC
jgi:alpha-mannosidase